MGFSGVIEKITGVLEKIKGIFSGLLTIVKEIKLPRPKTPEVDFSEYTGKVKTKFSGVSAFIDRSLDHVPEEKRRPLLIGLGGLVGLFLILVIAALALNSGKKQRNSPAATAAGFTIPQEELFIPEEPDFIPEFLFVREPRRYWTLEDIRPFWRAPQDQERWKEEIRSAVDQLMEGVP